MEEQKALQTTTTNYMVPSSGNTHAVSDNPVLSAAPTQYDFRQFRLDNFQFHPQGCFVDNTANGTEAVLTISGINFTAPIPAYSSMAFNFPSPKGGAVISLTGGGQVNLCFVDFPVMPQLSYLGSGGTGQSVTIPATPPNAQAYVFQELPKTASFNFGTATAVGASANIGPATANVNLRKVKLIVRGNSSLAAAGLQNIILTLNGVNIYQANVWVPAAAGANAVLWQDEVDFEKFAFNAGNGNLVASLGTAFATGALDVLAYYD